MNMPRRSNEGFTLIELMVVVAIIGVLAAVAIPNYQDYMTRAKVIEGIAALSSTRTALAEYYTNKGHWPFSSGEIALPESDFSAAFAAGTDTDANGPSYAIAGMAHLLCSGRGTSNNCSTIEMWFNVGRMPQLISSTYGSAGHAAIHLCARAGSDGTITWQCGPHSVASFGVNPRYLPANCQTPC